MTPPSQSFHCRGRVTPAGSTHPKDGDLTKAGLTLHSRGRDHFKLDPSIRRELDHFELDPSEGGRSDPLRPDPPSERCPTPASSTLHRAGEVGDLSKWTLDGGLSYEILFS
jgi:hypothetical protein